VKQLSKTEKTRQYIIETTAGIFNRKGYAGTSLTDLTEATGLTKGSIYGNFENKEEVALAAFDYNWGIVRDITKKMTSACQSYKDRILVYVDIYKTHHALLVKGGCPIQNTAVEADDTNEPLRKKAADAFRHWKLDIEKNIRRGVEAGEFKPDTEAEKVALSIIALIEGGILIGKATKKKQYMDLVLESIRDILSIIEIKS
jgi:TetR/AcrR family transcriptional repressor of nem operon